MGDCNICNKCQWYEPDAPNGPCTASADDACSVEVMEADLAADVPAVAEYERFVPSCPNCGVPKPLADAALAATVAYYEARLLERERCGGCQHWHHTCSVGEWRQFGNRSWMTNRSEASDPCHFIDAAHPHGRFEPIGGA